MTFAPLPPGPFGCILADPPWRFIAYSGPTIPSRRPDRLYESVNLFVTADPNARELDEGTIVQATVSLAVQRIGEWAYRNRDRCPDEDAIPSQMIVGVLTGLAIGVGQFNYDIDDVIIKGMAVMKTAASDAEGVDSARFATPTAGKN